MSDTDLSAEAAIYNNDQQTLLLRLKQEQIVQNTAQYLEKKITSEFRYRTRNKLQTYGDVSLHY